MRAVASASPAKTVGWSVHSFWVEGGAIFLQEGAVVTKVPPSGPGELPLLQAGQLYAAYAHDAENGYVAHSSGTGLKIEKTPRVGSASTPLMDEPLLKNVAIGGMADIGDALVVLVRWGGEPPASAPTMVRLWRVPKDGSPRTELRTESQMVRPSVGFLVLARLGRAGPLRFVGARLPGDAGAGGACGRRPEYLKFQGQTFTRRGQELIAVDSMRTGLDAAPARVAVVTTNGAHGAVLACGEPATSLINPVGVAANETGIYVAYEDSPRAEVVLARVAP